MWRLYLRVSLDSEGKLNLNLVTKVSNKILEIISNSDSSSHFPFQHTTKWKGMLPLETSSSFYTFNPLDCSRSITLISQRKVHTDTNYSTNWGTVKQKRTIKGSNNQNPNMEKRAVTLGQKKYLSMQSPKSLGILNPLNNFLTGKGTVQ